MNSEICDTAHRGRPLVDLAEALAILLQAAPNTGPTAESVPLTEARGRVLAQAVALDRMEPPVPRSAMDGYAIRSADGTQPREILATVYAGTAEAPPLGRGQAVAVMTGGTVAAGADAVVPVERTHLEDGRLLIDGEVRSGQHVRLAGEMGAAGRVILEPGRRLAPHDLAAIAGCGVDPLQVCSRPRVAVWSSGDEVVSWQEPPAAHQVRDSNRLGVAQRMQMGGGEVVLEGRVADRPEELRQRVSEALDCADLVLTIGGVSMGEKDHLPGVFEALGVECLFHGVAVQPGKPVWAGQRDGRLVLGLPGNPVSAMVVLALLGQPLLDRLCGCPPVEPPLTYLPCRVGAAARARKRERYLPAVLHRDGADVVVTPCHEVGSGDWTSLAGAEVLLRIPSGGRYAAGDPAEYLRL